MIIVILLVLVLAGIGIIIFMFGAMWGSFGSTTGPNGQQGFYPGQGGMMYPGGGMMYPGGGYPPYRKSDFESNGDLIYYTGYNESGTLIKIEYGPRWLYVHGGSCVNCHGTDGKGGFPVMMGFAVPSDIRYETLTSEEHGEEGEEEHPPYTDETIKQAIREGVDPAGAPLDLTMPRWDMSDSDLNDLLEYLKTL